MLTAVKARVAAGRALALLALFVPPPAHAHGPFHELIAAANERVSKRPDDPEGYIQRGELYRAHGEHEAALADFGRAARLAPGNDTLDLLRGRALVEGGRPLRMNVHACRPWRAPLEEHPRHGRKRLAC